jgi:hypothetical protein
MSHFKKVTPAAYLLKPIDRLFGLCPDNISRESASIGTVGSNNTQNCRRKSVFSRYMIDRDSQSEQQKRRGPRKVRPLPLHLMHLSAD